MKYLTIAVLLIAINFNSGYSDPMPPTWGRVQYDSTFINLQIEDDRTVVDIRSVFGVLKLVSNDYILSFSRESQIGLLDEDNVEIEVSDSLLNQQAEDNVLRFQYLSHVMLEDTLRFEVNSQHIYNNNEEEESLNHFTYYLRQRATGVDTIWGWILLDWNDPINHNGNGPDYYTRITSNQQLIAKNWRGWNWADSTVGREIVFEGGWNDRFDNGNFMLAHDIEIVDVEGVADTLTDRIIYELHPEVRLRTPDLIIVEDVRSDLDYYNITDAEILLEPDLAYELAPMWLWFPHDQTDATVELHGEYYSYRFPDRPIERVDTLEVREGSVNGQSGFYIHVPYLEIKDTYQPWDWWIWYEPELHVHVEGRIAEEGTARFILVTAPLDPSRITYTIPWGQVFHRWDSPFESVTQRVVDRRRGLDGWQYQWALTFYGMCQETGIAQVWYGDPEDVTDEMFAPYKFELKSIYPNPFNNMTTISFSIPKHQQAQLTIFDLNGREVDQLMNEMKAPGTYEEIFDAEGLPAGMYVAQLETEDKISIAKLVLMK